jgi:hypothetical protein
VRAPPSPVPPLHPRRLGHTRRRLAHCACLPPSRSGQSGRAGAHPCTSKWGTAGLASGRAPHGLRATSMGKGRCEHVQPGTSACVQRSLSAHARWQGVAALAWLLWRGARHARVCRPESMSNRAHSRVRPRCDVLPLRCTCRARSPSRPQRCAQGSRRAVCVLRRPAASPRVMSDRPAVDCRSTVRAPGCAAARRMRWARVHVVRAGWQGGRPAACRNSMPEAPICAQRCVWWSSWRVQRPVPVRREGTAFGRAAPLALCLLSLGAPGCPPPRAVPPPQRLWASRQTSFVRHAWPMVRASSSGAPAYQGGLQPKGPGTPCASSAVHLHVQREGGTHLRPFLSGAFGAQGQQCAARCHARPLPPRPPRPGPHVCTASAGGCAL